ADAPLADRIASVFAFSDGGQATRSLIADGSLPWWASAPLRVRFFRPLSASLMAADHALFGLSPLGYHVHSLLWWALWLAGAGVVVGGLLPRPPALFGLR